MRHQSRIRETLVEVGAINPSTIELLSSRTRDADVPVWRDHGSGVIFIETYYVGDDEYLSGSYRESTDGPDFEDLMDSRRRIDAVETKVRDRRLLDFGCGRGTFLRMLRDRGADVVGVELQEDYRSALVAEGIPCYQSLSEVDKEVDAVTMFHVLEHLPDPSSTLQGIRDVLSPNDGILIVEVPHAKDLLLSRDFCPPFQAFTLWSQHLVLHTRDSLRRLLEFAGYRDVHIEGVQRYGLANHMTWLSHGIPGGHRSQLATMETPELVQAYADALNRIDATDTLMAFARP